MLLDYLVSFELLNVSQLNFILNLIFVFKIAIVTKRLVFDILFSTSLVLVFKTVAVIKRLLSGTFL